MNLPDGFGQVAPYLFVEGANDDLDYLAEDRQSGVRDAKGNIWWLSQCLVEGPYR